MDESVKEQVRGEIMAALTGRSLGFNDLFARIEATDDRSGVMSVLRIMQQKRLVHKNTYDLRYRLLDDTGSTPPVPTSPKNSPATRPPAVIESVIALPATAETVGGPGSPTKTEVNPMSKSFISKKQQVFDALSESKAMSTEELAAITGLTRKQVGDNLCFLGKAVKSIKSPEGKRYQRGSAPVVVRKTHKKLNGDHASHGGGQSKSATKALTSPSSSDPVLEILRRCERQARESLENYLASVSDMEIVKPMRASIEQAGNAVRKYCEKHGIAAHDQAA